MINLKWNNKERCVEIARVLFIKDFILDKTQKRVQDAEMRAEPGNELPRTAIIFKLNLKRRK